MKKLFALLFASCFVISSIAQNLSISGSLADAANQPVMFANVVVLRQADSSLVTGSTTDMDGNFKIDNLQAGKVIIKASYLGMEDLFLNRELATESLVLGKLVLKEKATNLKEVTVVTAAIPVIQKGDTTQINADAYKTNPDASAEDLVTKMPGITIQDGKVQAQGETVQKVLVDGKEFFGDDANAVLKNLPAEVIDKIQIFDKKSDQSAFSGFDDGNTSKTLNIITKPQFRNGMFGKVVGGYGYDDKWKGGFNLNFFNDKRRLTILGNTNNINEQNFSTDDLLGVVSASGGGGGGRGRQGGGRYGGGDASSNFLVDQKNGITTTNAFGMNYSDQWKKVTFGGSYFLNYANNDALSNSFRQYVANSAEYTENSERSTININHRANFKIEWKIDSLNSLLIQPRLSVQQNNGESILLGRNNQLGSNVSSTNNNYNSDLLGMNYSLPVLYRHAFAKKGRTFSLNLTPGYNQNSGNSNLNTLTANYVDTLLIDSLNQVADLAVQGYTMQSNIVYTEPLDSNSQLMFSYGNNLNKSASDKETYNLSGISNSLSSFDTTLSNRFNSLYQSHAIGTSYQYHKAKYNFNVGINYQQAQLNAEQVFPYSFGINKTFHSLLPSARFQYKFTNKKVLRLFYRSSNNAPSVSQLQDVINNSNPLQLTTGNPDLKQDWQNSLTMRYSSSNTEKSTSLFLLLSGTYTQNYIVNSTFIAPYDTVIAPGIVLKSGSQLFRPVNQDGYFNLRSFNNYSFPAPKLKSNLSVNIGGTYSRSPGLVNNTITYTHNSNLSMGITISSNVSEKLDFSLSSNTNYNTAVNSLQPGLNSTYYNQTSRFKIQAMPWKGLVLQTELSHQYNTGLSSGYNQNFLLWNAALAYKFLKNNQGELRLSVFDLLKENNSISWNQSETYNEAVQTTVLQQYFLLTFTYNIKKYKNSSPPADSENERGGGERRKRAE